MKTADTVGMPRAPSDSGHAAHAAGGHGRWQFLRHYLEMVVAMFVGMVVLDAAVRGVLALAGLELPARYTELAALEMAATMSAGMFAWMRHRGHGWASTLEMASAMFAPALALLPLLWLGVISGEALLALEHLAMLPLMLLVMLRRRAEYVGASHASATPVRRPWTDRLKDRWPTALALALSAAAFGGSESDEGVASLANVLLLLPMLYLVVAKLRRPRASWPGLVIGISALLALRAQDVIAPAAVFSAVALAVLVWGGIDGQLRRPDPFRVQALGMLGFGALALAGLVVDPDLGRYLVATGWFLHGVWDCVHLKLNKVVARSYAEWCGVIDVLIAAELVLKL
jgi:hypothetical protein